MKGSRLELIRDWKKCFWAIRITIQPMGEEWRTHLAKFVEVLQANSCIYHIGDLHVDGTRTHFHGLITHWSRDAKAVGPWVKEQFPGVSRTLYQCTQYRPNDNDEYAYHKYIMKTGVLYTTYPSDLVDSWLIAERERQQEHARNIRSAQNKREREKKQTRDDHYDRLVNIVVPEFLRTHTHDIVSVSEWYPVDREYVTVDEVVTRPSNVLRLEDCCLLVTREYKDSYCTPHILEPIIHRLMFKFNPDYERDFARRLFDRISR